ncbi:MAG TPA: peptidase M28, partial [Sphingomicrobium sp.]|nr:peptidase M28 [Sphingomicrobium sp.]
GGDHTEFLNAGYPAVRFSVAVENYNYQHQDLRVENGVEFGDTIDKMDFPYLAKVAKLNVAALAWLASAPPPPEPTPLEGAVLTFTRVKWNEAKASQGYVVYWRRTNDANWTERLTVPRHFTTRNGNPSGCIMLDGDGTPPPPDQRRNFGCHAELKGIRIDDWVFGVSSVSADGFESPVASAVPGGAFKPWVKPAEEKK